MQPPAETPPGWVANTLFADADQAIGRKNSLGGFFPKGFPGVPVHGQGGIRGHTLLPLPPPPAGPPPLGATGPANNSLQLVTPQQMEAAHSMGFQSGGMQAGAYMLQTAIRELHNVLLPHAMERQSRSRRERDSRSRSPPPKHRRHARRSPSHHAIQPRTRPGDASPPYFPPTPPASPAAPNQTAKADFKADRLFCTHNMRIHTSLQHAC